MDRRYYLISILLLALPLVLGAVFVTSSQFEWNKGEFNGTSPDRSDNSGNLGIGYRNGTSSDGLMGFWRFDRDVSGSGGELLDYSGLENNGAYNGGVNTANDGIFGTNASYFDGSDDYVLVEDTIIDSSVNEYSITSWVKTSEAETKKFIFDDRGTSPPEGFSLLIDNYFGDDRLSAYIGNGTNLNRVRSDIVIPKNEWVYVASVYNGSSVKLYVNGSLEGEMYTDFVPYTGDKGPYIGDDTGGGDDFFNGTIDELRVYNRTLSTSEISELYFEGENNIYEGDYTSEEVMYLNKKSWEQLYVDSDLTTNTDLTATFESIDSSGNIVDTEFIDIVDGVNNYTLNSLIDTENAKVRFNGTSTKVSETWEVSEFKVYSNSVESPDLDVEIIEPPNESVLTQNKTFFMNGTVQCNDGDCGEVRATSRYNESSSADTLIPEGSGNPFHISNTQENEQICSTDLTQGETCDVSWEINTTGQLESYRLLDINASSPESEISNDSKDHKVQINMAILMDTSWETTDFGLLDPGEQDQSAQGNHNLSYNLTVPEESNTVDNLWFKATDLVSDLRSDNYSIGAGNMSHSFENDSSTGSNFSTSYQSIRSDIGPGTVLNTFFWLDVPTGIYKGGYDGIMYFKANSTR